jgi:hypothetical protein
MTDLCTLPQSGVEVQQLYVPEDYLTETTRHLLSRNFTGSFEKLAARINAGEKTGRDRLFAWHKRLTALHRRALSAAPSHIFMYTPSVVAYMRDALLQLLWVGHWMLIADVNLEVPNTLLKSPAHIGGRLSEFDRPTQVAIVDGSHVDRSLACLFCHAPQLCRGMLRELLSAIQHQLELLDAFSIERHNQAMKQISISQANSIRLPFDSGKDTGMVSGRLYRTK